MVDDLAPVVTPEQEAAAAAFDAQIEAEESGLAPETTSGKEPPSEVASERDYEAEARAMGWKPADEWTGDPKRHRDAQTFVEMADNDPAILRKKYHEEKQRNEEFQRKISAATKAQIERQKHDAEARYQQRVADLNAERDELFRKFAGDPETLTGVAQSYEAAKANIPPPPDPETLQWIATRPHFQADSVFKAVAVAEMDNVQFRDMQGRPMAEIYAELDRRLARRFPEYYPGGATTPAQPQQQAPGAPPAGARSFEGGVPVKQKTTGWERLPGAARQMYATLKEDLGDAAPSREEFAKDYFNG